MVVIEKLHYLFKRGVDKIDSQRNRNFYIPEIDLYFNEAYILLIKTIAKPRFFRGLGFEINSRTTSDIHTMVATDFSLAVADNIVELPLDYLYDIKHQALISKGNCKEVKTRKVAVYQHADDYNNNPFFRSDFDWRELAVVMNDKGIELMVDDFTVDEYLLSYIKKHSYMHYAEGYEGGSYIDLDGNTLTGKQDCLLPEPACYDLVDIAVYLALGDINSPELQTKINKLSFNQIL